MRFFINHHGVQKGPWTFAEVQQRLFAQEIDVTDYVFDEDRADWVVILNYTPFQSMLTQVSELKPVVTEAAPEIAFNEWFVLRGDNKYGPFQFLELVKLLQSKDLYEFDFVWNKEMSSWMRVADMEEFKPEKIKRLKLSGMAIDKEIFFRRKHGRAHIDGSILLHNNKEVWKGKSVEISAGGAGVILPSSEVQVGQDLFLHFKAGKGVPPFNAVCKIVSKSEMKNKEYRYGVKFTSISQSVQVAIKKFTDTAA